MASHSHIVTHMTPQQAKATLKQYKENEDLNLHGENYLLLAEAFKDVNATRLANAYVKLINSGKSFHVEYAQRDTHNACNHYYYQLKEIIKGNIIITDKGTWTISKVGHSGEWMLKLNGELEGHFKTKKVATAYTK